MYVQLKVVRYNYNSYMDVKKPVNPAKVICIYVCMYIQYIYLSIFNYDR